MTRALAFLSIIVCLQAQDVITTFAGGPKVFLGPATSTPVSPSRIAVGPNGEIYFGDREANVVVRLNADGALTVVAGNGTAGFSGDGGPATQAALNQPAGFAVDTQGNLYIGDARNFRVRKVDTNGIITTVAGNGQQGFSGDGGPATSASIAFNGGFTTTSNGHTPVSFGGSIAIDAAGNLYIADTLNYRVRKVSGGVITTVVGNGSNTGPSGDGGPATSATVAVTAVAADGAGNLYIGGGSAIRKVTPGGTISSLAPMIGAVSLATDPSGKLYASNGATISLITDGEAKTLYSSVAFGVVNNSTTGLYGIAADANGNIYAAADLGELVIKIPPNAPYTVIAGTGSPNYSGDGGPAVAAGLSAPNSMAIDTAGTIYIADSNNRRIRAVDGKGVITTFASLLATEFGIYNIAMAADGGILVDDRQSIQEVRKDGSLVLVAGGGTAPAADGQPVANTAFGSIDIASDTLGNIYAIDISLTVRKIDKNGILSTPGGGVKANCSTFLHQCIATDSGGNVYVATGALYTIPASIAKITSTGAVSMIPITGVSAIAGIAVDSKGNIYLSDSGNHNQVQRVSPDGKIAPFAGNGLYGFSGDGGPPLQASLLGPVGLLVDPSDNLYIADNINNRVRRVSQGPTALYAVSPSTLTFLTTSDGTNPPTQTLALSVALPASTGLTQQLAFSATSDSPWLTVTPSSGTMPATLQVSVNLSLLKATPLKGYQGAITIFAPLAANPTRVVTVNVVPPPLPAKIVVSSSVITFSAIQGLTPPPSLQTLTNVGSPPVGYTTMLNFQGGPKFLTVSPSSGPIAPALPVTLTFSASTQNLTVGSYNATVSIKGDNGQTVDVTVTLTITAPQQKLVVSQAALAFTGTVGSSAAAQTFGILNLGTGAMSWTASAQPLSGSTQWLTLDKTSGTVVTPFSDVSLVTVKVNSAGLSVGDYFGQIVVTSAAGTNSPQVIPVVFSVVAADPGIDVAPSGLIFRGGSGAQDILVTNRTGKAINFTSAASGVGFTYAPGDGLADPSRPTVIHVSPDFPNVPPGDFRRGTITFSFADGSVRTVSILSFLPSASGNK
jgi:sugar lactone lactonase YvrE